MCRFNKFAVLSNSRLPVNSARSCLCADKLHKSNNFQALYNTTVNELAINLVTFLPFLNCEFFKVNKGSNE